MRVLILEDEPIIAIDLEDIVSSTDGAQCVLATSLEAGMDCLADGVDFALLDINLGPRRVKSFPLAFALRALRIPFCFVSSSSAPRPETLADVPVITKPFRPTDITGMIARAA